MAIVNIITHIIATLHFACRRNFNVDLGLQEDMTRDGAEEE